MFYAVSNAFQKIICNSRIKHPQTEYSVIDGQEKGKVRDINNLLRRDQIKNMTPDAEKKAVIDITTFKNL